MPVEPSEVVRYDELDQTPDTEPTVVAKKGLYPKLLEAIREVESVSKDGRNDFHKYDYTTAEAILRAVRKPLLERGLILLPSLGTMSERSIRTAKGGESTITTAHVKFTFIDAETGEAHDSEWAGSGDDPSDKGIYKAYTGAIKTFLREAFMLPMGDDPEGDKNADERGKGRTASTPAKSNGVGPTIGEKRAKAIYAGAALLDLEDKLQLAASHVAGEDVGPCVTEDQAVVALLPLTVEQADRLDAWLQTKADAQVVQAREAEAEVGNV